MSLQNGITEADSALAISTRTFSLHLRIVTSADVKMTDELRASLDQAIGDTVWRLLPVADDGDVFVDVFVEVPA